MERLPVSDLEHMDRLYLWRASKASQRVHLENPETGRAHCQAENCGGGKPFDGRGAEIPAGRRLCGNCIDLAGRDEADYREPDVRVLMGERIAETELGLFASAGAAKSEQTGRTFPGVEKWKRKKTGAAGQRVEGA